MKVKQSKHILDLKEKEAFKYLEGKWHKLEALPKQSFWGKLKSKKDVKEKINRSI